MCACVCFIMYSSTCTNDFCFVAKGSCVCIFCKLYDKCVCVCLLIFQLPSVNVIWKMEKHFVIYYITYGFHLYNLYMYLRFLLFFHCKKILKRNILSSFMFKKCTRMVISTTLFLFQNSFFFFHNRKCLENVQNEKIKIGKQFIKKFRHKISTNWITVSNVYFS